MQKTDHYKEINFHAGHRVTGGRVYAYFVSTMERLRTFVLFQDIKIAGSHAETQLPAISKIFIYAFL